MLRRQAWNKVLARYFSVPPGVTLNHSSQLRVVSTNQWPIPYYKRESWFPRSYYPENEYNVMMDGNDCDEPDSVNVYMTQTLLNQFMWGREILDTVQKLNVSGTLNTVIGTPALSADIYTEDLMRHLDFSLKENTKILKKHKFSDIFE